MNSLGFISFAESGIEFIDGDRGVNYPSKSELRSDGYCVFLNTGNVKKTGFDFSLVEYIDEEKDSQLRKGKVKKGDIILTTRGTVGNVAIVSDDTPFSNIRINSGMVIVRANPEAYAPYFILLFFRSFLFEKQYLSHGSGSAQPQLPISALKNISFPNFNIESQREIVKSLIFFDKKIEINNRINAELEAMAKTLYDYWFVQFDFPDANGKPYKTSGGKMVYNSTLKREIPEGWDWKPVSLLIEVKDGTHDSPKPSDSGQYLITSKHLKLSGIDFSSAYLISQEDFDVVNKRSKVDEGDFLLSMIGTVGISQWAMKIETPYAIKNIGLFKTSQAPEMADYIFSVVTSLHGKAYLQQNQSTGTSQPYVTLGTLRNIPILIPAAWVFKNFNKKIKPIHKLIYENNKENNRLAQLRDWLLPMLMNGQVTVG